MAQNSSPRILITNDDGVASQGLQALAEAMAPLGDVWVCAPDREQSAVSHGISIHRPLRVNHLRPQWFSVDGTPTDCVMLAIHNLLDRRPDLVISGINNGANLGDDVTYSGTVAGAHEGMLLEVDSIAISNTSSVPEHPETSAHFAQVVAAQVLAQGLDRDTLLNVNVPDVPLAQIEGVNVTRLGRGAYNAQIVEREDPRGIAYYWIGGTKPDDDVDAATDNYAVAHNRVSVTPLKRDITSEPSLARLQQMNFD